MSVEIYHTSPEKITEIHEDGYYGDVFFWASRPYWTTGRAEIYKLELNDNEIIEAYELYDEEIITKIAKKVNVDLETAEKFLKGSINEWDYFDANSFDDPTFLGEFSWFLQKCRGYASRKMGYIACKDHDEQGSVYIIRMKDVFQRAQLHEKFY
ncbi:AcrIF11 family anti-CRISPR ADP-ribosyltransferase (plasmid) [Pigmentibacter ruber]